MGGRTKKKEVRVFHHGNNPPPDVIERRRQAVASLRLRGLSEREIAAKLPELGIRNGEKSWCRSTINIDLTELRKEWRENAKEDTAVLIAEEQAQLFEVRRVAWENGDLETVLKSHDRLAKLLGLNAPNRIGIGGLEGGPVEIDIDRAREKFRTLLCRDTAAAPEPPDGNSD